MYRPRKRIRARGPRRPLPWNARFLQMFVMRLFENLESNHFEAVILYFATSAAFTWATACSGTESPQQCFHAFQSAILTIAGVSVIFEHVFASEILEAKREWIQSRPGFSASYMFGDMFDLSRQHATDFLGTEPRRINISDLPVIFCFLCGFSCCTVSTLQSQDREKAGAATSEYVGTTGSTFLALLLWLQRGQPMIFVLENVEGLLQHGQAEDCCRQLQEKGYIVVFYTTSCTNYGVPQDRRRVWFVGWRKDIGVGRIPGWKQILGRVVNALMEGHPMTSIREFILPENDPYVLLKREQLRERYRAEMDIQFSGPIGSAKGEKWKAKQDMIYAQKDCQPTWTRWSSALDLLYPNYIYLPERAKHLLDAEGIGFPHEVQRIVRVDQGNAGVSPPGIMPTATPKGSRCTSTSAGTSTSTRTSTSMSTRTCASNSTSISASTSMSISTSQYQH